MTEEQIREIIREELNSFRKSDRYIFDKLVKFNEGKDILLGVTTGTKIGTANTEKLGLWGTPPVVQPATIAAPSGGATQDAEARTAIASILTALKNIGIIDS